MAEYGNRTKGSVLWLSTIPERDDVERLLDARVPHRRIVEWLATDRGYGKEATFARLKAYVETPAPYGRGRGSGPRA